VTKKILCILLSLSVLLSCALCSSAENTMPDSPPFAPQTQNDPNSFDGQRPPMPPVGKDNGFMPEGFPSDGNGDFRRMPRENFDPGFAPHNPAMDNNSETVSSKKNHSSFLKFIKKNLSPIVSVILLIFGFVFVVFYKRKEF